LNTSFTSTRRTFCKHLGAAAATTFFSAEWQTSLEMSKKCPLYHLKNELTSRQDCHSAFFLGADTLSAHANSHQDATLAASLDAYWAAFTTALKLPNLSDLIQCLPYL
jgi:hypothetical protein